MSEAERPGGRVVIEDRLSVSGKNDRLLVLGYRTNRSGVEEEVYRKIVRRGASRFDQTQLTAREAIVWATGVPSVPEGLITSNEIPFGENKTSGRYRTLTSDHERVGNSIVTNISSHFRNKKGELREAYSTMFSWEPEGDNSAMRRRIEKMQRQALGKAWRGLFYDKLGIKTGRVVS